MYPDPAVCVDPARGVRILEHCDEIRLPRRVAGIFPGKHAERIGLYEHVAEPVPASQGLCMVREMGFSG